MPSTAPHVPHMRPRGYHRCRASSPRTLDLSLLLVLALVASVSPSSAAAASAGVGAAASTSLVLLPPRYGARCLDGSPPGFYHRQGYGAGRNKWLVYLQGGGWCYSVSGCRYRAETVLGSTKFYVPPSDPAYDATLRKYGTEFRGMLSASAAENPSFFNWNTVMVLYCDGGGFAGSGQRIAVNRTTTLYSDGSKIVDAVLKELTARRGMASAAKVVLSGCSAGGQAVSAVCNRVGAAVPRAQVKCLMDGGFFLDADDVTGQKYFRTIAKEIVALHKPVVDPECRKTYGTQVWKCFFPQNNLFFVQRPVYIVNSIADFAAIDIANKGQNASSTSRISHCINRLFAASTAAAAAGGGSGGGGAAVATPAAFGGGEVGGGGGSAGADYYSSVALGSSRSSSSSSGSGSDSGNTIPGQLFFLQSTPGADTPTQVFAANNHDSDNSRDGDGDSKSSGKGSSGSKSTNNTSNKKSSSTTTTTNSTGKSATNTPSSSSSSTCTPEELSAIQTYSRRSIMRIRAVLHEKPSFGFFLVGTIGHCTTIYPQWGQVTRKKVNMRQQLTKWIGP